MVDWQVPPYFLPATVDPVAFPPDTEPTAKVDISSLLLSQDEAKETYTTVSPVTEPVVVPAPAGTTAGSPCSTILPKAIETRLPISPIAGSTVPAKRRQPAPPLEVPAKRQSKWSADEDALITELRGSSMKWNDISNRIPGRSAIGCRLHYQNYLKPRSEWDEDLKNMLARQYERFRREMWTKIADILGRSWRSAEAMHWQLGKQEMARRAGVKSFSLSNTTSEPPQKPHRHRATTPRSRRDAGTRGVQGQQLPPVAELSAGAASSQSREHYPLRRSPKSPTEQSRVGTPHRRRNPV
ncbi:hypothetical protein PABG_05363 [Paracoccidioides brasiliensis Pb03]|nr:hypothetical protein PABG_05363 [Paracoccidioides brasiliensis Pb03]